MYHIPSGAKKSAPPRRGGSQQRYLSCSSELPRSRAGPGLSTESRSASSSRHYENNYGSAVRTLNAIRERLSNRFRVGARPRDPRRKAGGARRRGSVALHELYFGSLGIGSSGFTGDGPIPDPIAAALEKHFGGFAEWRREFRLAQVLRDVPGGSCLAIRVATAASTTRSLSTIPK